MKLFLVFLGSALTAGCVTAYVTPVATGGSKSDGIIEMSYERDSMIATEVDRAGAMMRAKDRCVSWGYDDVEPFDAGMEKCISVSSGICSRYRVTTQYQCFNYESETARTSPAPALSPPRPSHREKLRQIQESMACDEGARILEKTAESVQWELNCGDGELLEVRCFEEDCYLR